jgi:hypothetical protein
MFTSSDNIGSDVPYQSQVSFGYKAAIHCNYIQKLVTDDITNKTISLVFPDESKFPFMVPYSGLTSSGSSAGQGWSATNLFALIQMIPQTGDTVVADPAAWKIIDITDQIFDEPSFTGKAIPPANLSASLFNLSLSTIESASFYDLSYLNYPSALSLDDNKLAFGEEVFFYGNVKTDIEAVAYTTDIAINLPVNEYNFTDNPTWDGLSSVYISEIGIFDELNNLVAIAKLNYPVDKNASKARSFAINIDF